MRLCEDCKWYKAPNTCDAPRNRIKIKSLELVRRDRDIGIQYGYRWLSCSWLRSFGWSAALFRACGASGRWFERRRPGFFDKLTPEQQRAALEYSGPDC